MSASAALRTVSLIGAPTDVGASDRGSSMVLKHCVLPACMEHSPGAAWRSPIAATGRAAEPRA